MVIIVYHHKGNYFLATLHMNLHTSQRLLYLLLLALDFLQEVATSGLGNFFLCSSFYLSFFALLASTVCIICVDFALDKRPLTLQRSLLLLILVYLKVLFALA